MQEYSSLAQVEDFELSCGIVALNCACLDLVELDGRSGKMDSRDVRPESSENDGL
jgi:hypothetical protein